MALPTLRMIAFILGIFLITLAISMGNPVITQLSMTGAEERLSDFVWPAAPGVGGAGGVRRARHGH